MLEVKRFLNLEKKKTNLKFTKYTIGFYWEVGEMVT